MNSFYLEIYFLISPVAYIQKKRMDMLTYIYDKMENLILNSDAKFIINKSSISNYLSTGKLHFFNHVINVDLKFCLEHINNMVNLIKNNNIQIRSISDKDMNYLNSDYGISFYISDNTIISKSLISKE